MTNFKRYKWILFILLFDLIIALISPENGQKTATNTLINFKQMLSVLPPIFILLGLLDAWVPRETIIKLMGDNSGLTGIVLSIFLGAAAAGPLYGAFPVAVVMIKKGAKLSNVITFLGAWSTLKIPMFLFEISALGRAFAVTRWLINIPGIILIGYLMELLMTEGEKQNLRQTVLQNFQE
ncbi:permease [Calderihabitans maritimus]|uniref:Permease n=1 Tax=Calderihabitans maritimus TaxID=1246530 RepID=A0A1Z5HQ37_9FIRM|nr:permease [Calderihabitans maritimus]GAW91390.1 hypothetical protein TherJR_0463 [Calderihabitans maritimus]